MTASFLVDLCLFVVVSSLSVFAWRHFGVVSLSCCRILSLLVFSKRLFVVISLTVQQEMLWRGSDNKPATCHLLTPRVHTCVLNVGNVSRVKDAHVFCQLSLSKVSKVEGCHRKQMFYLPPSLEQDGSKQAPIFAKVNFALVWPPGFWHESGEGGQSDSRERAVPPLWPSPSTNKAGLSSIHSGCEFTSS